jgi:hypothetical protein
MTTSAFLFTDSSLILLASPIQNYVASEADIFPCLSVCQTAFIVPPPNPLESRDYLPTKAS